jgi:hypothetical protein
VSEVDPLDFIETIRKGLLDPDLTVRIAKRSSGDTFTVAPENIPRDEGDLQ